MALEVAKCEACGAPYSEAAVVAIVPVCGSCGAVSFDRDGTLGTISAFGVDDPALTRRRFESDLGVLLSYERNSQGLVESNRQQLAWPAERYAVLPARPIRPTPRPLRSYDQFMPNGGKSDSAFWAYLLPLLTFLPVIGGSGLFTAWVLTPGINWLVFLVFGVLGAGNPAPGFRRMIFTSFFGWIVAYVVGLRWLGRRWLYRHRNSDVISFNLAQELQHFNEERNYETARASAIQAAESTKLAQDHRLRVQIRDSEGQLKTIRRRIASVRSELARRHER